MRYDLKTEGLSALIEKQMNEWNVPGLAVGIVKDGEVVFAEGFGYRDVKNALKMTANTILPIGSSTKSFTALALGMLADEGKLDFDKPVREYIPWFKMYDPVVTERVTTRDLLCHRTGLPSHFFTWFNSSATRKEIVESLRYLMPFADFRTTFEYQNHMVMTAGYIVEAITGMTWEEFIQERVFNKLGMNTSNFTVDELPNYPEYAKPYKEIVSRVKELDHFVNIDVIGPAGSINSTAADMTKYLIMQLNKGKFNGEQLVSEARLAEMHAPQMIGTVIPWKFEEIQMPAYGLCWFTEMYRGHRIVEHGGNIDGFTTAMVLLPEENAGMIILSNMDGSFLPTVLFYNVLDRLLGLDDIDWSLRLKPEAYKFRVLAMKDLKEKIEKERIQGTKPSHNPEDYAGEYTHPAYGVIKVEVLGGEFKAKHNMNDTIIEHYHYDKFKMTEMDYPLIITFVTNDKGEIDAISVPFEPSVDPIILKKVKK